MRESSIWFGPFQGVSPRDQAWRLPPSIVAARIWESATFVGRLAACSASPPSKSVLCCHDWQVIMSDVEPDAIFDTPTGEASELAADDAARAEIASGRFVRHDAVIKWIRSWGKPDELPCPNPPSA